GGQRGGRGRGHRWAAGRGRGDRALPAAGPVDPDHRVAPGDRQTRGLMSAVATPQRRPISRTQQGALLRAFFMGLYVLISVFPFYWMFITAFKTNRDLYTLANNPLWFNELPTLDHLQYLFARTLFGTWMLNSLIIGVLVVVITLLTATPAGYALARLNLPGAQQMGIALFATYLVPPSLLFIPLTRVV